MVAEGPFSRTSPLHPTQWKRTFAARCGLQTRSFKWSGRTRHKLPGFQRRMLSDRFLEQAQSTQPRTFAARYGLETRTGPFSQCTNIHKSILPESTNLHSANFKKLCLLRVNKLTCKCLQPLEFFRGTVNKLSANQLCAVTLRKRADQTVQWVRK